MLIPGRWAKVFEHGTDRYFEMRKVTGEIMIFLNSWREMSLQIEKGQNPPIASDILDKANGN